METQEIHTVKLKEEMLFETGTLPRVLIELCAQIDNNKLREVTIASSSIILSMIPSTVPREENWEYLEKLIEFLNKVLELKKK